MFKYILEGAGQINWMAISALITFITIFVVSAVTIWKSNPAYIDKMAHMPLDDGEGFTQQNSAKHEQ